MPSARSANAAASSRRPSAAAGPQRATRPQRVAGRPGPQRAPGRPPKVRVRWERVGRIGLLVVLTIVVGLYVQHALAYVSARSQADQQQAIVDRLARQNAALNRQARSLNDPATIVRDARELGMVRPGEQPYVITGH